VHMKISKLSFNSILFLTFIIKYKVKTKKRNRFLAKFKKKVYFCLKDKKNMLKKRKRTTIIAVLTSFKA